MALERTLSIVKPDAVAKNVIGEIYARFEKNGLKIVASKMKHLSRREAEGFYAVHRARPFFNALVEFMISGPVMIQALEGNEAIAKHRELMGATDPKKAAPGTIRADFAQSIDANAVNGSDGADTPRAEIAYFFAEPNKEKIKTANNVANPGCFATAIQLGLLPLAKAGLLDDIYTTGIPGSTGAGQGLNATSHFSWRANNIQAYKTLTHQHLAEIGQSFMQLNPSGKTDLSFVPWRGDFTRGIFISSQIRCDLNIAELRSLYKDYYAGHPFVSLSNESIFLKQVVNTNQCFIQLEKVGTRLVIHSIIDNLLKGASGQAVQNMNLMFSLSEITGLKLKANYF